MIYNNSRSPGRPVHHWLNRILMGALLLIMVMAIMPVKASAQSNNRIDMQLGLTSIPETMNPFFAYDTESEQLVAMLYLSLYTYNENLSLKAELADLEIQSLAPKFEDGSYSVVIPIKRNIQWLWPDGSTTDIRPEDVVTTFEVLKKNKEIAYRQRIENIKSIQVYSNGQNSIKITWEPNKASYDNLDFIILPERILKRYVDRVTNVLIPGQFGALQQAFNLNSYRGAHAYRLKSFERDGRLIELEAARNYSLDGSPMIVSPITLATYANPQQRWRDLNDGLINFVIDLEPSRLAETRQNVIDTQSEVNSPVVAEAVNTPTVTALLFNYRGPNKSFISNINNRRALANILNTQVQAEMFKIAYAYEMTYNFAQIDLKGPFVSMGETMFQSSEYNSVRAFRPPRQPLKLMYLAYSLGSPIVSVANQIAQQLRDNGVDCETELYQNKRQFYEDLSRLDHYDLVLHEWNASTRPDISMWDKGNFMNYTYTRPNFKDYYDLISLIGSGQSEDYATFQRYLYEDCAAIFLWNRDYIIAYNDEFNENQYRKVVMEKDPAQFTRGLKYWRWK